MPVHEAELAGETAGRPAEPGAPGRAEPGTHSAGGVAHRTHACREVMALVDGFGRTHTNLRISVTDRCNIRCFYCMPEDNVQFMDRKDLLSFEEIERFVLAVVPLGIN